MKYDMKYFVSNHFNTIIFVQLILFLTIIFSIYFSLINKFSFKDKKIFRVLSILILFTILLLNIFFYFTSDPIYIKNFSIFSIILSLNLFIVINFIESSKIKFNKISYKIFFNLIILSILTFTFIYLFRNFSFPLNFLLIISLVLFLFILLFNFFDKFKKIKEEKEDNNGKKTDY